MKIEFIVNGQPREFDVAASETLLKVLREAGCWEVKEGCGEGVCGSCTVLFDDQPVSSCLVLAPLARGHSVITVRGLQENGGSLHPLQEALIRHGAVQCGFCTPGIVLTAFAFVERTPDVDREAIREALAGNLCRCTGYAKIVDAIEAYVKGVYG